MKKKVVTVSVTVTRGCSEGVCVTVTGRVTGLLKTKKRNHSTRLPKHAQQQNTPNQRRDQTPLQTPLEARPATSQNTPPLTRVFHRVIHRLWKTFSAGLRRGRIHPSRPIVSVRFVVCKFLSLVVVHVVSFRSFRSVCKFLSPRFPSCRGHPSPVVVVVGVVVAAPARFQHPLYPFPPQHALFAILCHLERPLTPVLV